MTTTRFAAYTREQRSDCWDRIVGGQTPQQFCEAAEAEDVSAAVANYLDEVQAQNPFPDEAPITEDEIATLQRALVEYIEDDLAIEAGRTGYTLASAAELGDLDPDKLHTSISSIYDARARLDHPCTLSVYHRHDGIAEQIGHVDVTMDDDGIYHLTGEAMAELCDEIEAQLDAGRWSGECRMYQDQDAGLPRCVDESDGAEVYEASEQYEWSPGESWADAGEYRPTQYDRVHARWHRGEKRPVVARKIWGVRWAYRPHDLDPVTCDAAGVRYTCSCCGAGVDDDGDTEGWYLSPTWCRCPGCDVAED